MARYHVLLARDDGSSPWRLEFGAYDKAEVSAERLHYRDSGSKAGNLRIVTSNSDRQACLDYIVSRANEEANA